MLHFRIISAIYNVSIFHTMLLCKGWCENELPPKGTNIIIRKSTTAAGLQL